MIYINLFDSMYDYNTVAWSLMDAGFSDLNIIVGGIGWPMEGYTIEG